MTTSTCATPSVMRLTSSFAGNLGKRLRRRFHCPTLIAAFRRKTFLIAFRLFLASQKCLSLNHQAISRPPREFGFLELDFELPFLALTLMKIRAFEFGVD